MLLLATRLSLADRNGLIAGIPFVSSDSHSEKVSKFFRDFLQLDYPSEFVSIACFDDKVPTLSLWSGYGGAEKGVIAFLRRASVMPDIVLASHDDIQDIAVNGWDLMRISRQRAKAYAKRIIVRSPRLPITADVLARCAQNAPDLKYAEARIHRALTIADVERFEPPLPGVASLQV